MRAITRLLAAGTVVSACMLGTIAGASAGDAGSALARAGASAYPGEAYSQYYRRGYGRGYYGRGYGYRRGYGGGAAAAGIVGGLALGALAGAAIAGSQPVAPGYPGAPVGNVYGQDPNWVNYCASKYRSFDAASGTYLGRDGYRYPCE